MCLLMLKRLSLSLPSSQRVKSTILKLTTLDLEDLAVHQFSALLLVQALNLEARFNLLKKFSRVVHLCNLVLLTELMQ